MAAKRERAETESAVWDPGEDVHAAFVVGVVGGVFGFRGGDLGVGGWLDVGPLGER